MNNIIKAVIFDMDGVLINTESILKQDEFLFLNTLTQKRWTRKDQHSIQGLSVEDVYELLVSKYQFKFPKSTFLKKYHLLLEGIYRSRVQLNPAVLKLLNYLKSKNYRLALCSSTSHKFITIVLQRFALDINFKTIVSADDIIGKGKPEPDIFLYTAKKLNISFDQCLVIEDSLNGIRAAKKAGMLCIAYRPLKHTSSKLADYTIKNFKELMEINLNNLYNKSSQVKIVQVYQQKIYLFLSDQVNKSDYYSDFLLSCLIKQISKMKREDLKLLEVGTGRGYLSIVIAKLFVNINHITVTDIDSNAVNLAYKNIILNSLEDKISVKHGDLFKPLIKYDKFNVVFSAPPQMPLTKKDLLQVQDLIPTYHLTTSIGGQDGQKIIRQLIDQSYLHLKSKGLLMFVQADFSNPQKAIRKITSKAFTTYWVKKKKKLLKETHLTRLLKSKIEKKGYKFHQDIPGEDYFNLEVITAKK